MPAFAGGVKLRKRQDEGSVLYAENRPLHRVYRVDRLEVCGARADTPRDH